jgi:hypothetical protein
LIRFKRPSLSIFTSAAAAHPKGIKICDQAAHHPLTAHLAQ